MGVIVSKTTNRCSLRVAAPRSTVCSLFEVTRVRAAHAGVGNNGKWGLIVEVVRMQGTKQHEV